jgi:Bacterial protein of unknown function (DUF885)
MCNRKVRLAYRACRAVAYGSLMALSLLLTAACSGPAKPAATTAAAPTGDGSGHDRWPQFAADFLESYFKAHPFFAVQAGRHEFDGQMADWSATAIAAEIARLTRLRAAARAFDTTTLSAAERFERDLLVNAINNDLFWLERARFPFTNPAWYIERLDPDVYVNRDYAPLAKRLAGYIGYLRAIPKIAADIRANLHTPLPPTFVQRGIDGFGGYAEFFRRDAPQLFAAVSDPKAQQDLSAATTAAVAAMEGLKSWLETQRGQSGGNFALGEGLFVEMLKATEGIDVPLAQLIAVGRADLERNSAALRQACAQYLPRGTLSACVARVSADKPKGGAVDGARALLEQLRDFIVAHQVVDIPSDERPLVAEAPPYNRANAAYINIPGPYEKGVGYTFNIAPPDPNWSARERAEYIPGRATLLYTSVHEVWPGHFLQFLHSNRSPSKIAALFVGYAYAEGWAHYAEEMMWEEGLGNGDAEQHIGQLTEALLRNVRYLAAIGLHTQGMTPAEAERMFREVAYTDPGDARQQAARGTYDPEYLKYTLGKLIIRKLRTDWGAQQPAGAAGADPRASWRTFHDKLLSYGGPPLPMVRRAMVGEGGSLL